MVGKRFGRLLVTSKGKNRIYGRKKQTSWVCKCDCGNTTVVMRHSLTCGLTKSCGCLQREVAVIVNTTHGMSESKTYNTWRGMIDRCSSPSHEAYKHYGGRGIIVCERWLTFENFLADMGERPAGLSIDRYPNNDGNYEPGNCRWATPKEQRANQRMKPSKGDNRWSDPRFKS